LICIIRDQILRYAAFKVPARPGRARGEGLSPEDRIL
jgi:hypothetical protein